MLGAIVSLPILAIIAAVHLYWAAGGQWGKAAAVPERDGKPVLTPGALGTLAVAGGLAVVAVVVAMQAGVLWPGPLRPVTRVVSWAAAVVFGLRAVGDFRYVGFFKQVKGSRFARLDTVFYAPLCVVLAIAVSDVAAEGA